MKAVHPSDELARKKVKISDKQPITINIDSRLDIKRP